MALDKHIRYLFVLRVIVFFIGTAMMQSLTRFSSYQKTSQFSRGYVSLLRKPSSQPLIDRKVVLGLNYFSSFTGPESSANDISPPKRTRLMNPNWEEQKSIIRKSLGLLVTSASIPTKVSTVVDEKIDQTQNPSPKKQNKSTQVSKQKLIDAERNNPSNKGNKKPSIKDKFDRFTSSSSTARPEKKEKEQPERSQPPPLKFVKPEPNRPFSLPPGEFKPKQSLGQNYLTDQNYVNKIVMAFDEYRSQYFSDGRETKDESGSRVVEIGPGVGALSRVLHKQYPDMTAIEIDQRSVALLAEKLPNLRVIHQDVLTFDWRKHAEKVGGKITIVANLPYHIVSQVLFSLADASDVIACAVVTMQYEVAERVTATHRNKDYGIPSVVFQLYGKTRMLFKIPPTVFYPVPKVDSALVAFDFTKPSPILRHLRVNMERLRLVVSTAFRQRRKMMRQSLKSMLQSEWAKVSRSKNEEEGGVMDKTDAIYGDNGLLVPELPLPWSELRPEQLTPEQFVELTVLLFGELTPEQQERQKSNRTRVILTDESMHSEEINQSEEIPASVISGVWRRSEEKAALLATPNHQERRKIKKELDLMRKESSP